MRAMLAGLRRLLREESGQVLPIFGLMLLVLLGMGGVVFDFGKVYFSSRQLQSSADAAALAGAQSLPALTAITAANTFSGMAGGMNANPNMPGVTMVAGYPQIKCLSTLSNQGSTCIAPANGNAIVVKEQVNIPMTFGRLFGNSTVTLTATATASMHGSNSNPYNVAIIIDSTPSMGTVDKASNCTASRLNCAETGVRTLLGALSPCGVSSLVCGLSVNGNVSNAVTKVALYTFPGVASQTEAQKNYNCAGKAVVSAKYSYPTLPVYQIVPFSSDYRDSDTASALSVSSDVVIAAGGNSPCKGIQISSQGGTYYAGVIYQAQADLLVAQAQNPKSKNMLILLSDGDASASASAMPGASLTAGIYPSTINQCHQAILAAQAATASGTVVYSVAYGTTATGCTTDKTTPITPCQTMQAIASQPSTFYSDYEGVTNGNNCLSAAHDTSSLAQIFLSIANDPTYARLIPDNTP